MPESIFRSAFRSFCKGLFWLMGILAGGLIIFGVIAGLMASKVPGGEKPDIVMAPNAENETESFDQEIPKILRIDIHGVIGMKPLTGKNVYAQLAGTEEARIKGKVKAILLHIDSPGGGSIDSDKIFNAIQMYKEKLKVPVYAYADGLCASGGMYVACAADKIYASQLGIIGSIGVRSGPFFNVSKLMETYGVGSKTITEGKDKDMLNPFRPWKEGEAKSLEDIDKYEYNQFVDLIVKHRPRVDKSALVNEYGAQVFSPVKAQEIGYIDVAGSSYSKVLTELAKEAKLGSTYQVIKLRVTPSVLSELIDPSENLFKKKMVHTVDLGPEYSEELRGQTLFLYNPS